jgi:hypothetical protein
VLKKNSLKSTKAKINGITVNSRFARALGPKLPITYKSRKFDPLYGDDNWYPNITCTFKIIDPAKALRH